MTPAFSVLLCLGLCLCNRTRTQEADRLPRPSLQAENGSFVSKGGNVTLRCRALWEAEEWRLEKYRGSGWLQIKDVRRTGNESKFSLLWVTSNNEGTYQCLYRHSSYGWSKPSNTLEVVVTGSSPQPSLIALPSSDVASGQDVTLQCWSEQYYDWCVLYKDGKEITHSWTPRHEKGRQVDFLILAVNPTHHGTYRCYSFRSSSPNAWSSPSAPLVLRVTDAAAQDYTVGNVVHLILAGLVLILLGVLLIEHWKNSRGKFVQGVLG